VLEAPPDGQPGIAGTAYYGSWVPALVSLNRTARDGADVGTQWGLRLVSPKDTKPGYAPDEDEHYLFVSAALDDTGAPFLEMHFNCGWSGCAQWYLNVVGKRRGADEPHARISEAEKRRLGIGFYTREDDSENENMPEDAEFLEDQTDEESSDDEDKDDPKAVECVQEPSEHGVATALSAEEAKAEGSRDAGGTSVGTEAVVTISLDSSAAPSASKACASSTPSDAYKNGGITDSQKLAACRDAAEPLSSGKKRKAENDSDEQTRSRTKLA
jgi:hypothetical protein